MFRDDRQIAAACDALTRWMGKGQLWREGEMTDAGLRLRKRPGVLSSGERLIFRAALSLWNSFENKGPRLEECVAVLDPLHMRKLATLIYAVGVEGAAGVDRWLEANQPENEGDA